MCRQSRYIFKDESWEIPRGFVNEGETPFEAAHRELAEEAKLRTERMEEIGSLRLSIGLLNEQVRIFLAQNVTPVVFEDKEHEIDKVKKFSFKKVLTMIEKSEIVDGLTVVAILKATQILNL